MKRLGFYIPGKQRGLLWINQEEIADYVFIIN